MISKLSVGPAGIDMSFSSYRRNLPEMRAKVINTLAARALATLDCALLERVENAQNALPAQ